MKARCAWTHSERGEWGGGGGGGGGGCLRMGEQSAESGDQSTAKGSHTLEGVSATLVLNVFVLNINI